MRVLISRGLSAVAYGADVPHNDLGRAVVIRPGRNRVTAEDADFLKQSPSFQKHARNGTFTFTEDDAPEPGAENSRAKRGVTTAAPGDTTGAAEGSGGVAEDPRARKPKESDKSYAARMAKLDDETAQAGKAERDRVFLETYNAMTGEEQTALYLTLTDNEKALIDGRGK